MELWLVAALFMLGVFTQMFASGVLRSIRCALNKRRVRKDIEAQLRFWSLDKIPGETFEESKVRIRREIHGSDRDTPVVLTPLPGSSSVPPAQT